MCDYVEKYKYQGNIVTAKLNQKSTYVAFYPKSALTDYNNILSTVTSTPTRIEYAKEYFAGKTFSRKDYIFLHKDISTATASRDLKQALEQEKLQKLGDKN